MAPSPTIRRLLRETAELSTSTANPNPAFHASPVSDADLHEWHFTILGPPAPSPYAGGMYHGRITLPPSYPLKPPNFRFLTPSGRFEVNREICLSISGFHEETWMPAWGVRTALTALRSFMAEAGSAGQVGGLEASDLVRKRLATESRTWRCDVCQKSNEQGMREWWENCTRHGVRVEGDEEISLEALPEGLNLEARLKSPVPEQHKGSGRDGEDMSRGMTDSRTDEGQRGAGIEGLGIPMPNTPVTVSRAFPTLNSAISSPSIPQTSDALLKSPNTAHQVPPSLQVQSGSPQMPATNLESSLSPRIASTLSPQPESQLRDHSNEGGVSGSLRHHQPVNDTIHSQPSTDLPQNINQTPEVTSPNPQSIPNPTHLQTPHLSHSTSITPSPSLPSSSTFQPPPTPSISSPNTDPESSQAQIQSQPNPLPNSQHSQQHPQQPHQNQQQQIPHPHPPAPNPVLNSNINTIDRAIAFVFLALCLMVLKKAFYPAGAAWEVDEYYLQRA